MLMKSRVAFYLTLAAALAHGQSPIQRPEAYVLPTDRAILESGEPRTDLPCTVKALPSELGFDLTLHSRYEVALPLRALAGEGGTLVMMFRVTPERHEDQAIYFNQRWSVPPIAESAAGAAHLQGGFRLGEGKYRVDWLLRDSQERFCTARWQVSADLHGKDRQVALRMKPGMVAPEAVEAFAEEAPIARESPHPLRVGVLLHVASQGTEAPGMRALESSAVLSILRSIAREPQIGSYSVTAFNLERGEVLFRDENTPDIDFPALGKAIKALQLATIDIHTLRRTTNNVRFISDLMTTEVERNRPDALIFVGPKTVADFPERIAPRDAGSPGCPVFYLNYDANPASNPWRDMIGSMVKVWSGAEYTISRPRDLFNAWSEVMARLTQW